MSHEKLSFWAELKRRRVYRTAAWYAASVFALWQVADIVIPSLGLPEWSMKAIIVLSAVGFIPALVLSWAYDVRSATPTRLSGRSRLVLGTVAIAVLASTGWWVTSKVKPATPTLSEVSLAVFPFSVRTGNLAYLREGLVDLLSRNLTGTADLQPVDPSLMLKLTKGEPTDVQRSGSIAREVGAGRFVNGSVSGTAGRVRIDATLYALKDSVEAVTTRMVEGDTTQLFLLVDQLTAALLAELTEGAVSERSVRTAASTTQSLPALKAYLQGEQAFRQGNRRAAIAAFQDAGTLDSTFVLARYRLAMAYQMNEQYWLARNAILNVMPLKDRLQPHDRRLADAFLAFQNGSISQAERDLQAMINEFPRDLESRVLLADLIVLYSRHRAESQTYAVDLLESVLDADPKFVCIRCKLAELSAAVGRYDKAERLFRLLEVQRGGDSTKLGPVESTRLALFRGDTALARWQLSAFDFWTDSTEYDSWLTNPGALSIGLGHLGVTDAILTLRRFGRGRPDQRLSLASTLHFARGEWKLAQEEIVKIVQGPDPDAALTTAYATVTNTPFEMALPAPNIVRDLIARVMPDTSAEPINEVVRAERGIRIFTLGLIASRTGDAATALAYADSLAALEKNPLDAGNIRNARRVLLADRALRENKLADALTRLEAMSLELRPGQLRSWPNMLQYAGALRVRTYISLGRNDDAVKWLRYNMHYFGNVIPGTHYGIYQRDMATVLDQLGRGKEAAAYYAAFVNAWQNADPELRPQVASAGQRLSELLSPR